MNGYTNCKIGDDCWNQAKSIAADLAAMIEESILARGGTVSASCNAGSFQDIAHDIFRNRAHDIIFNITTPEKKELFKNMERQFEALDSSSRIKGLAGAVVNCHGLARGILSLIEEINPAPPSNQVAQIMSEVEGYGNCKIGVEGVPCLLNEADRIATHLVEMMKASIAARGPQ